LILYQFRNRPDMICNPPIPSRDRCGVICSPQMEFNVARRPLSRSGQRLGWHPHVGLSSSWAASWRGRLLIGGLSMSSCDLWACQQFPTGRNRLPTAHLFCVAICVVTLPTLPLSLYISGYFSLHVRGRGTALKPA
jgi:hypothetical protein